MRKKLFSMKKTVFVAFAYVGILTGAGLASGRELIQYFISFGISGLIGVIIIAALYMIFGNMILSLGSYYRAQNHSDVLEKVTHPVVNYILDYAMMFSCFVLSFVMIAGAGSSIGQQFQIPSWIGSMVCAGLILVVSYMDFSKVMGALGIFTPVILIIILIALVATFLGPSINWAEMVENGASIDSSLPNIYVSVLNYFSLCMMTSTSMLFVLGGSVMGLKNAKKGGVLGGFLTGFITIIIALLLYSKIDIVSDANVPMQMILENIHPLCGVFMALTIFGMIFNTGFSVCYSLAKRIAGDCEPKFRKTIVVIVLIAFVLSFVGFKTLVAIMYPILGYVGFLLLAVLLVAWVRERNNIKREGKIRRGIFRLMMQKEDSNEIFTTQDKNKLDMLIKESSVNDNIMRRDMKEIVKDKQN